MNPNAADTYHDRALVFSDVGRYREAVADLLEAERRAPDGAPQVNGLAWFFSTCPDAELRNGGEACGYIERALELDSNDLHVWDTCAAVFAEIGDFEDAIIWEQAYLERTDLSKTQRKEGEERLALYKARKPYRQQPEGAVSNTATASVTPAQREK